MSNKDDHAAIEKAERRIAIAWAVLVLCFTCLIGASFGSLGIIPLLAFVGAASLYALILRVGFLNEIEAAVLCEILLILALLLFQVVQHARSIAPKNSPVVTMS